MGWSNYPEGVSGMEPQITGEWDDEEDEDEEYFPEAYED